MKTELQLNKDCNYPEIIQKIKKEQILTQVQKDRLDYVLLSLEDEFNERLDNKTLVIPDDCPVELKREISNYKLSRDKLTKATFEQVDQINKKLKLDDGYIWEGVTEEYDNPLGKHGGNYYINTT